MKRWNSLLLIFTITLLLNSGISITADAADGNIRLIPEESITVPALLWVESSDTNGIPSQINVFISSSDGTVCTVNVN